MNLHKAAFDVEDVPDGFEVNENLAFVIKVQEAFPAFIIMEASVLVQLLGLVHLVAGLNVSEHIISSVLLEEAVEFGGL